MQRCGVENCRIHETQKVDAPVKRGQLKQGSNDEISGCVSTNSGCSAQAVRDLFYSVVCVMPKKLVTELMCSTKAQFWINNY